MQNKWQESDQFHYTNLILIFFVPAAIRAQKNVVNYVLLISKKISAESERTQ